MFFFGSFIQKLSGIFKPNADFWFWFRCHFFKCKILQIFHLVSCKCVHMHVKDTMKYFLMLATWVYQVQYELKKGSVLQSGLVVLWCVGCFGTYDVQVILVYGRLVDVDVCTCGWSWCMYVWLILVYVHMVILAVVFVDGPLSCWTQCGIKKRVVFCDLGLVCFNV